MHLRELHLRGAPGLASSLVLDDLPAGLVLLLGPNASGKSTIGRTLRGTLWPAHAPPKVDARSTWMLDDATATTATLVFGNVGWDGPAPTPSSDLALPTELTLQELLRAEASSDRQIARKIQTQLAGGYDLAALSPVVSPRVSPRPSLKKPFVDAERELAELGRLADDLDHEERQLQDLQEQARQADEAVGELEQVKKAQRRLKLRDASTHVREALQALPQTLADLPPHATEEAERRLERAEKRAQFQKKSQALLKEAQAQRARHAFPGTPPSQAELEALQERAEALVRLKAELDTARQDQDAGQRKVDAAAKQVWADPGTGEIPDRKALEALDEALQELTQARSQLAGLPEPLEPDQAPLDPSEAQRRQDARTLLRQWLAAPRQVVSRPGSPLPLMVLMALGGLIGLVGLLTAVLTGAWVGLPVVALGCLVLGTGLGAAWASRRGSQTSETSEAEAIRRRYQRRELPPVRAWTVSGVEAVLDELDRQLAVDAERQRQAQDAARLKARHKAARDQVDVLERARVEQAQALGLSAELSALSLNNQAERLRALALAKDELASVQGRVKWLEGQVTAERDELRQALLGLGLDDLPALEDARSIRVAARAALERRRQWQAACEQAERAQGELDRASADAQEATREAERFLQACGLTPGEVHRLPELESQKHRWDALTQQARDLERELATLDRELPDGLPQTEQALQDRADRLAQLDQERPHIHDQIAKIKNRIAQHTQGRTIEQAIAARNRALDDLVADRDLHLEAHAAQALLEGLRSERQRDAAPELLRRARDAFLDFTHHRYELQVDADGRFVALDHQNHLRQSLAQLSDGTRIQLLFAARLAFIEHAEEGGEMTPLFLDEVLTTTDPQRFEAIATAVLRLAEKGRQVFYATADAGEVQAFKRVAEQAGFSPPHLVELGPTPQLEAWTPPPRLPQPRQSLPKPDNQDAITWIARLGLPRPSLHDPVESWPLPLLLHDRLEEAHRAAEQGVDRAGHLELAEKGVALPLSDDSLALARARRDAVRAVLEALRVGRGRRVTWEVVASSGAVTSRFEEDVQEALRAHQDDPGAFLDAVDAIPKFRNNKLEELQAHLSDHGIYDPRPLLSEAAVTQRASSACSDDLERGLLTVYDVRQIVDLVQQVVELERVQKPAPT